jgi:hypothetical protein
MVASHTALTTKFGHKIALGGKRKT